MSEQSAASPREDRTEDQADGQVSEVSGLDVAEDPISPSDATAGAPADETLGGGEGGSGITGSSPQEGTAGPNLPPEDGDPQPGDQTPS